MAVKKKSEKQTSSWIGEVEKYSRQIWLAGLGAYSKVSKDGTKLFDTLVKDGEKAEKAAKSNADKQADAPVDSSATSTRSRVDEVKNRAIGKWGEFEEAFDKRLNSAISRLGVPSRSEVKALNDKVDLLTRQLEKLTAGSSQAASKPAAKAVATKPSSKAATASKAPAGTNTAGTSAVKPAAKPAAGKPVAAKQAPVGKAASGKPASAAKSPVKAAGKAAAKPATKAQAKSASKPATKKPVARKASATPAPAPAASTAPSGSES